MQRSEIKHFKMCVANLYNIYVPNVGEVFFMEGCCPGNGGGVSASSTCVVDANLIIFK